MHPLAHRSYVKMNGLGNAILLLDLREASVAITEQDARAIHAGLEGVPYDQIMALYPAKSGGAAFMRIFNNDGSEVSACGNGTRCVAWYEMRRTGAQSVILETQAGLLICTASSEPLSVTVDMGAPRFGWKDIPLSEEFRDTRAIELQVGPIDAPLFHSPSVVNVGNPHAIFWVDDVEAYDLGNIGFMLEHHPLFPERANISLAHVTADDALTLKVWERGAGLTQACGTAACAAAVSAARTRRTGRSVTVTLPGGPLHILWRESDDHILMTGPVELEHEGTLSPSIFAGAA